MTTYEKLVWIAENAKCGLYLTHNQHKDYYETAERYIKDREWEDEVADGALEKIIERDEVWELQVYTRTPIGSYRLLHWNLEDLVNEMYETVYDEISPSK